MNHTSKRISFRSLVSDIRDLTSSLTVRTPTFEGGVKVRPEKEKTQEMTIADYMDPKEDLVFPLTDAYGNVFAPLVAVGDKIQRDEVIARTEEDLPLYSSVSGTVKDITMMATAYADKVRSIVVENDHSYTTADRPYAPESYSQLTEEEIRQRIFAAGIVEPTSRQILGQMLTEAEPYAIHTILIDGAETEPQMSSAYRLMLEDSWRIVNGIRVLAKLFPEAEAILCIADDKPKAIEVMGDYIDHETDRIRVEIMRCKYPQHHPLMLAETVLHKEVKTIPDLLKEGIVVISVDTAIAVSRAVTQGRPLQRCIVTLSGDCLESPRNYRVRIGTSVRELIENAGVVTRAAGKTILGGPITGTALTNTNIPITKSTACILLLSEETAHQMDESACIRCGRCVSACPMLLEPYRLEKLALKRDWKHFEESGGMECIDCGTCSYVCPAKRKVSVNVLKGKTMINERRELKIRAEAEKLAETRFDSTPEEDER